MHYVVCISSPHSLRVGGVGTESECNALADQLAVANPHRAITVQPLLSLTELR